MKEHVCKTQSTGSQALRYPRRLSTVPAFAALCVCFVVSCGSDGDSHSDFVDDTASSVSPEASLDNEFPNIVVRSSKGKVEYYRQLERGLELFHTSSKRVALSEVLKIEQPTKKTSDVSHKSLFEDDGYYLVASFNDDTEFVGSQSELFIHKSDRDKWREFDGIEHEDSFTLAPGCHLKAYKWHNGKYHEKFSRGHSSSARYYPIDPPGEDISEWDRADFKCDMSTHARVFACLSTDGSTPCLPAWSDMDLPWRYQGDVRSVVFNDEVDDLFVMAMDGQRKIYDVLAKSVQRLPEVVWDQVSRFGFGKRRLKGCTQPRACYRDNYQCGGVIEGHYDTPDECFGIRGQLNNKSWCAPSNVCVARDQMNWGAPDL